MAYASRFGWSRTVDRLMTVYAGAMTSAPVNEGRAPASFTRALPS
jgi:hypothetical protein